MKHGKSLFVDATPETISAVKNGGLIEALILVPDGAGIHEISAVKNGGLIEAG